jgi:cytochrome b561
MFSDTSERYGLISRLLHWLTVLLVVGMLLGGAIMTSLPSGGLKSLIYAIHKSTGVVIWLVTALRLAWRLFNPAPRALGRSAGLNYLARVLHVCLYVLLFLQPLLGVLMSQSFGYPVSVFGWFELPGLVWQAPALGQLFREAHGATAVVLTAAVAIHAAAALKHHFIDRDRTLMRMIHGR